MNSSQPLITYRHCWLYGIWYDVHTSRHYDTCMGLFFFFRHSSTSPFIKNENAFFLEDEEEEIVEESVLLFQQHFDA